MRSGRTITISLPPQLARKVDRLARAEGRTRSELLRESFRQYADRLERWQRLVRLTRRSMRGPKTEAEIVRAVKEYRRSRTR